MDRHTFQMALGGAQCQNDCRAAAVNVSRQKMDVKRADKLNDHEGALKWL